MSNKELVDDIKMVLKNKFYIGELVKVPSGDIGIIVSIIDPLAIHKDIGSMQLCYDRVIDPNEAIYELSFSDKVYTMSESKFFEYFSNFTSILKEDCLHKAYDSICLKSKNVFFSEKFLANA